VIRIRLVGIAIGSLFIAALAMSLVGTLIPPLLGTWTVPVATLILGGLVFQDIARRERRRSAADRAS
jgi:uncharacterized membrane protein YvlD (DUF360 family)